MSRTYSSKKDKVLEKLIKDIRKSPKYKGWRDNILRRDVECYPKIPKGIQVHHRKEMTTIIRENNIRTVQEAMACTELWQISNGVVLKRGEHFILTRLRRYKYLTRGFHEFILDWLSKCLIGPITGQKRPSRRGL